MYIYIYISKTYVTYDIAAYKLLKCRLCSFAHHQTFAAFAHILPMTYTWSTQISGQTLPSIDVYDVPAEIASDHAVYLWSTLW